MKLGLNKSNAPTSESRSKHDLLLKMKLILQYQELLILNDMEEADNELIEKLNQNRTKKQELQGKSVDIVQRLLEIRNLEATNARSLQQFNKNFTESIFPSRE